MKTRTTKNICVPQSIPDQSSRQEHPDWDMHRIQGELLGQICIHATATGDYALGLQAIRTDAQNRTLELKRDQFKESHRTKIMAGIDALAEEAKKNPTVRAAVQHLRNAIHAESPDA